jgi:uncharacterized RmlC-like cupin family protein
MDDPKAEARALAANRGVMVEDESAPAELLSLYDGKGLVGIKRFTFGGAAAPANFVLYLIPPGASEGMHAHGIGGKNGGFEEYYYIVAGRGEMQIDGDRLPVEAGDHVYVPLDVAHGIENDGTEELKVFLTFIRRD